MPLGAFSISLSVKDLAKSEEFYAKLGFVRTGGDPDQNWLILKNGDTIIGLFQGMFEGNLLTFNPGWNQQAEMLESFTDVRDIQKKLKSDGIDFHSEADESTAGPASFTIADPDGNVILVDQHR
ncbi:MAG: VOC family protein [Pseudomonadota bacterium]